MRKRQHVHEKYCLQKGSDNLLDKSVKYKPIIMCLKKEKYKPRRIILLPRGYKFKFYEKGDEKYWAEIEYSVGEFDSYEAALEYFQKDMKPYEEELMKRMVFIVNKDKIPVANACCWYKDIKGVHQAHVHYVAVRPEHQNKGLGKAVFLKMLSLFEAYEPNQDIYLHTQTWSHKAIRMYLKYGFEMVTDELANYHEKQREEAIQVLKEIIPDMF